MATIYCIPKQGDFAQIDVTLAASGGFIRLMLIGQDDRQMEAHLDAAGADKLTKALLQARVADIANKVAGTVPKPMYRYGPGAPCVDEIERDQKELVVNIIHWRDPKGDNEKSLCRAEERATFTGEVVATLPYPNQGANCPACRQLYWVERAEKLEQEKEKKP